MNQKAPAAPLGPPMTMKFFCFWVARISKPHARKKNFRIFLYRKKVSETKPGTWRCLGRHIGFWIKTLKCHKVPARHHQRSLSGRHWKPKFFVFWDDYSCISTISFIFQVLNFLGWNGKLNAAFLYLVLWCPLVQFYILQATNDNTSLCYWK